MSQKTTRRARRQTNDDDSKSSTPKPTDAATEIVEESQSLPQAEEKNASPTSSQEETKKVEQNGTSGDKEEPGAKEAKEALAPGGDTGIITRSRAATPQVKKVVAETVQNGHDEAEKPPQENIEENKTEEEVVEKETAENEDLNTSKEEMDPLVVDEPDPELVFEESSDVESGKSSPVLSRCKTRRSQTRYIPTPNTPRAEEKDDLNSTFESCSDDISTKAEAGGDSTRLDYIDKDFSNLDNNSFLQGTKDKSFGEALRCLSTRRTIRPISDDYRKRLLKSNIDKADFGASYPSRNSVERVSSVGGTKRKHFEEDESVRKRFKSESPGFFSRLTSPLNSIRNSFRSEIPSSTPKLTGYKDEKFLLEDGGINSQMCEVSEGERRWCSIM